MNQISMTFIIQIYYFIDLKPEIVSTLLTVDRSTVSRVDTISGFDSYFFFEVYLLQTITILTL